MFKQSVHTFHTESQPPLTKIIVKAMAERRARMLRRQEQTTAMVSQGRDFCELLRCQRSSTLDTRRRPNSVGLKIDQLVETSKLWTKWRDLPVVGKAEKLWSKSLRCSLNKAPPGWKAIMQCVSENPSTLKSSVVQTQYNLCIIPPRYFLFISPTCSKEDGGGGGGVVGCGGWQVNTIKEI